MRCVIRFAFSSSSVTLLPPVVHVLLIFLHAKCCFLCYFFSPVCSFMSFWTHLHVRAARRLIEIRDLPPTS